MREYENEHDADPPDNMICHWEKTLSQNRNFQIAWLANTCRYVVQFGNDTAADAIDGNFDPCLRLKLSKTNQFCMLPTCPRVTKCSRRQNQSAGPLVNDRCLHVPTWTWACMQHSLPCHLLYVLVHHISQVSWRVRGTRKDVEARTQTLEMKCCSSLLLVSGATQR